MATKSLPDRIDVLVAVQPTRLAMCVSQGDLRVRCQDHDLDDREEGGGDNEALSWCLCHLAWDPWVITSGWPLVG